MKNLHWKMLFCAPTHKGSSSHSQATSPPGDQPADFVAGRQAWFCSGESGKTGLRRLKYLIPAIILLGMAKSAIAASPVGDVVGKVSVGYQGWFSAPGDGSPLSSDWWHYCQWGQTPSWANTFIYSYPDVRDYTTTFQSGFANLGNGQPAKLFSSYTQQTVNTHFQWMQQAGIDTAALQRFNDQTPFRDAIAAKVKTAAETYGRKFYIMYDISGWASMNADLKADWTNKMKAHTTSTAYAKQSGKPVVCIWMGNTGASTADLLDIVNWFKGQNCYVILGTIREWRNDSARISVYNAANMITPWMVGVYNVKDEGLGASDNAYNTLTVADQAYCNSHSLDYQPCVVPGDLSNQGRMHGDFMWRQFWNMIRGGCQGIYIAMFDEYNECNQIAKTAENVSLIPVGSNFKTLDEDGTPCSSDYYLRLTGDGGRMLKGQIPLTSIRPTETGGSAPQNNTVFHLICVKSGKSLDNGDSTTEGAQSIQWDDGNGNVNQEWKLVDVGGGYYNLICQKSGKALDNSGSSSDGTIMKQWTVQGGNFNQHWKFISTGNGCYNIVCRVGGKALDNGGSTSNGTAATQWTTQSGNINQQWKLKFIR
jgi:hypothetical protein